MHEIALGTRGPGVEVVLPGVGGPIPAPDLVPVTAPGAEPGTAQDPETGAVPEIDPDPAPAPETAAVPEGAPGHAVLPETGIVHAHEMKKGIAAGHVHQHRMEAPKRR